MNNIVEVILKAGDILKEQYSHVFKYSAKGKSDLLSEVDVEIERVIIDKLKELTPEAGIFSEEAGVVKGNNNLRWIIDPIDGTTNFIFGVPHFCISISLESQGEIVEAYIYNPLTNELYHTNESDTQSFLNGSEIQVSDTSAIEDALVVFGFSANFENITLYNKHWQQLFAGCKKGLGVLSPALNICNVARGRIDCFMDFGSSMEGHGGASLILTRAGGKVTNYDLTPWDHRDKGVIASNKTLMPLMRSLKRE